MLSHLGVVVGGVILAHVLMGAFTGFAFGLVTDDIGGNTLRMTGAALAYLPAVLVVVGVGVVGFRTVSDVRRRRSPGESWRHASCSGNSARC